MTNSNFYVYSHNRLGSGRPFYIGKGRGKRAGARSKRNQYWNNIVTKDGGFDIAFLATGIDEEFAFLIEMEVIDKYRRLGIRLTNMTDGGEGSSGSKRSEESRAKMRAAAKNKAPVSEETRKKMSANMMGNSRRRGVPHTDETKQKLKGRTWSDASRKKMSESRRGKPSYQRTAAQIEFLRTLRVGCPLTDEHKAALLKTHLGKPHPLRGMPQSAESKEKRRKTMEKNGTNRQSAESNLKRSETMKKVCALRKSNLLKEVKP